MSSQKETAGRVERKPAGDQTSQSHYRQRAGKVQVHGARAITKALGGDWSGRYGLIPGPGHSRRDRSLLIRDGDDGNLVVHSFSGDDWRVCRDYLKTQGFVIDGEKCDFQPKFSASSLPPAPTNDSVAEKKKIRQALSIWEQGEPAAGSPVEVYLHSRGLTLRPDSPLRFHPACPRGQEQHPAMLALMTDAATNLPCGIHRTFIRPNGSGKADGERPKMMLGRAKGAVIRLTTDDEVTTGLGIVEGIENGLTIMGFGWLPVWAALSATGISDFPVLAGIQSLTIFADHDSAGLDAARTCALRWIKTGREVLIRKPLNAKTDWNDAAKEIYHEQ